MVDAGMKLSKRQSVLNAIRFAAYHKGSGLGVFLDKGVRVVSYAAYLEAERHGIAAKRKGVPCSCVECRQVAAPTLES